MPKQYVAIRDKCIASGESEKSCKTQAAKIYNSKHPNAPVTGRSEYKKGGLVEKRDPSSHRTPSQIRAMDRGYNSTPEMIHRRGMQNAARSTLAKEGKVRKGDGMDVDHKHMLDHGGTNARSNLHVVSQKKNRGWRRDT